jgi:hypothetical protein
MARKQRVDSITAQVAIMQAAVSEIAPPEHLSLTEKDLPFWRTVIAEKPKAEWTAHDLEIAALLAMSMRKLGEQEVELETEGPVYVTGGGNMAQNPRCRIVADLAARVVKYRQTLGIHNRAKQGEARDVAKRREQAFAVESDNPLGDDLIARPMVN